MRRLFYLVPLVAFLGLVLAFATALRPGYDPHVLPSAMLDKPAPAFVLAGLQDHGSAGLQDHGINGLKDQGISREGLLGQPAVINFFASWCVPCRIEHPLLMRLAKDSAIRLYGIAYKDKPEDSARLLTQLGNPYRAIGMDRDGVAGLDFGVYGVPETYVLDKAGIIRKKFVGPLTADAIETELLPLLKALGGS